ARSHPLRRRPHRRAPEPRGRRSEALSVRTSELPNSGVGRARGELARRSTRAARRRLGGAPTTDRLMITRGALALGFRRLVSLALVSLMPSACAPNRNCLKEPRSPLSSDLVWREHTRALESPPALRARILESLPSLIPDLTARLDEPNCESE